MSAVRALDGLALWYCNAVSLSEFAESVVVSDLVYGGLPDAMCA